jgi:hypothetical protein
MFVKKSVAFMHKDAGFDLEKAYKIFLSSGQLDKAKEIVSSIISFEKSQLQQKNLVSGKNELINLTNVYLTQKTLEKLILNEKFNIALILATVNKTPIRYPLKKKWAQLIRSADIPISSNRCSFLFGIYRIKSILFEVNNGIKNTKLILKIQSHISSNTGEVNYQFINGMHPVTILQQNSSSDLDTFRNWLSQLNDKSAEMAEIIFLESVNFGFRDILQFIFNIYHYLKWSLRILRLSSTTPCMEFLSLTRLFQISTLLMSNRVIGHHKVTLFMEGGYGIVKEVWMEKSGKKNFQTVLVLTSASIEPESEHEAGDGVIKKYQLSSWDMLYVIDQVHKDRLIKYGQYLPEKIVVLGPIYWTDVSYEFTSTQMSLAVFDTEPQLNSYNLNRLFKYGYHDIDNSLTFLSDIFSICEELGIHVFFKSKRLLTYKRYPAYREFLANSKKKFRNLEPIPEYVSATRVIKNSNIGAIAFPGSTTALISEKYGKPAVYYDPISSMQKFDKINGIDVIHGKKNLKNYLTVLISN